MARTNILYNFLPYTWYDISLYPMSSSSQWEAHPFVILMVKFYDAESDQHRYYKVRGEATPDKNDHKRGWQKIPRNHRVVAFMHDGMDLPFYRGSDAEDEAEKCPALHPMFLVEGEQQRKWREEREGEERQKTVATIPSTLKPEDIL